MTRPDDTVPTDADAACLGQLRGAALALHDDGAIVSETVLERGLERARAAASSPIAGVFGPDSLMWRINRDAIIFAAAGRALLLQLAHPWVAAAVADHSAALSQPIARFHRTFGVVFALVFGTVDQAMAAARRLHRRHCLVTGTLPTAVGPFKEGSRYCANNISALRWVYATLIDSALAAHELVRGELSAPEREQYYSESRIFAALFGIPSAALPPSYRAFTAYAEAMRDSDILTVSAPARRIARQIFAGGATWLRVPLSYQALTLAMLPERLRGEFGLPYGAAEARVAERAMLWVRQIHPMLPARLRYVAPYHEAVARLSGRSRPDAVTRLLNRFWIGRGSLGNEAGRGDQ